MLMTTCTRCGRKKAINVKCECNKDRHKIYNREFRDKDSAEFYNSKQWKSIRNICKAKANGLDIYELIVNNNFVKGTLSHHIEELKDNRARALDINNLIWISDKTHNYIHTQYDKSDEDKKNMQNKLFDILNKYYNDEFILFEMMVGGR
jgi:hypothetical protein